VAAAVIGDNLGMSTLGDATEGVFAQAHDPGEQELATGGEGGLREGGGEFIDDGAQRVYHSPHGGTSHSFGLVNTLKDTRNPFPFTPRPPPLPGYLFRTTCESAGVGVFTAECQCELGGDGATEAGAEYVT